MRIAIVHHHLRPGGVTRVIRTTSEAFRQIGIRHVVLSGEADPSPDPSMPVRVVPGLGYAGWPSHAATSGNQPPLTDALQTAASEALGAAPDVWHLHNPTLGKNPEVTRIIGHQARNGERLVLHLHDFAEEGRPALHRDIREIADRHPHSPRIRHVVLNPRSRDRLIAAGLPRSCVDVLPNPITTTSPPLPAPPDATPPLLFAPVRCIRRKNAGEMLLLTTLAPAGSRTAVSLAPNDPDDLLAQQRWQDLARDLDIAIEFAVSGNRTPAPGAGRGFDDWLAASTHILGTSVAEGFGLPFLEAVAWGRRFIGRNLPHLTQDHAAAGIHCGSLYDRLLVPGEWIGESSLHAALRRTLAHNHRLWIRPLATSEIHKTFERLWGDGWIDFGNLTEPLQETILRRLADRGSQSIPLAECDGRRMPLVDWLADALAQRRPDADPEQLEPWSPARYADASIRIYRELIEAEPSTPSFINPQRLLDGCLDHPSFHFLCSARPQIRAVVFDLYGTLLVAPPGAVRHDPQADAPMRAAIRGCGFNPPVSPSQSLAEAVRRHHLASDDPHPEVDLRQLWREILQLPTDADTTTLVIATERARLPASLMPGAADMLRTIAAAGLPLGILSNAQCNALHDLGNLAGPFDPALIVLSYQHGCAKPSPKLFTLLASRLAQRGIHPDEALIVGNDPLHDIAPAQSLGFQTALFTGHPDCHRPGIAKPDLTLNSWTSLTRALGLGLG